MARVALGIIEGVNSLKVFGGTGNLSVQTLLAIHDTEGEAMHTRSQIELANTD